MTATKQKRDLHDLVRELTERHKHAEPYGYESHGTAYTTEHVTEHAPLLDQLAAATQLLGNLDDGVRLGFGSKPSARIDAIDSLRRIDHEAKTWGSGHATVADSVRHAASHVPAFTPCGKRDPEHDCCRRHVLEWQIRRWWTWARLTTGWDRPAWRPDATCPICAKRGVLRIRLDQDERTAMCTECKHTWDEETIGHLALHIKAESECTQPGCDQRVRRDGKCATHSATLAPRGARVTVSPLGEVSPHQDPPDILRGLIG